MFLQSSTPWIKKHNFVFFQWLQEQGNVPLHRALPASWTLQLGMFLFLKRKQKTTPQILHFAVLHMKWSLLLLIKFFREFPLGRCYNLNCSAQLLTWCLSMVLLFAINNIFILLLQLCSFGFSPKVLKFQGVCNLSWHLEILRMLRLSKAVLHYQLSIV